MGPILRVENLSKQYRLGQSRGGYSTIRESLVLAAKAPFRLQKNETAVTGNTIWALHNVSFEVKPGEVVGIIGRNGAGKSTLLKVISRITEATYGRIELYGRVGSLLEVGTGFHPELTGRENIYLNGAILGMRQPEIRKKFAEIVEFAEIEKFIDTPVKYYSSGMYTRLAFAVAAHLESEILIVDEVLAVGDIKFQKKCLAKMNDVAKCGRTVLFVSHNLAAMKQLCHSGLYFIEGQLAKSGAIDEIVDAYWRDSNDSGKALDSLGPEDVNDGEVRYVDWRLENGKTQDPHACLSGEVCDFSLFLVCRKKIEGAVFGFTIRDLSDQNLLSFHTKDSVDKSIHLDEGTYHVKWRARVPIRQGQYRIIAGFADEYDDVQSHLWFAEPLLNVLAEKSTVLPEHWLGLVNESYDFDLQRSSLI